jgi:hypothetical protein
MRKELISFVIVVMAALLINGCATQEGKVSHSDLKGKTINISTGDWYEACDKWAPGSKVTFKFVSSQPVMFNVHFHDKNAKKYAVKDVLVDEFGGSFVVQSEEIYCCMWKNDNPKYVTMIYNMSVE